MLPQQYCLRWKYHHSNLQTMFSQLLDRGCFCDVTLACEGQIIRAHRVVLCACSTFFDTLLSNYATEPIIIMKDAKFADVKCLIEFMYKGEINVEHANLASLLKTAEDLKIKGLAEVSWREDEFDSTIPAEPEQKFHEGILPTTTIPTSTTPIKDNLIQNDGINSIPQHRIPRMPLLTPIPSPIHQTDNCGPKRKRGRPPLDDSYDVFNSPKLAFIKNAIGSGILGNQQHHNNNNHTQSPFRDSPIVVENQLTEDLPENLSPRHHNITTTGSSTGGGGGNIGENLTNTEGQQQHQQQQTTNDSTANINEQNQNQDWIKTQNLNQQDEDSETTEDDKSQTNDTIQKNNSKTEPNDDYDYYDQNELKSDTILDDMDADNSMTAVHLTSAELEEWKDVVKMDAYLSRGRRPQFWEEPFTKRVMDAIKSKKLEMKKAAQVLGVSYGTLYGRYRETYGCLKHPYRNQQYYAKRLRGALATIRRCEEVLTVQPDGSNYQEYPKIDVTQQNDIID